jgi:hypothetical protein
VGGLALTLAAPLIAGHAPTSLLPPGFGDEPAPSRPAQQPQSPTQPATTSQTPKPGLQLDLSDLAPPAALPPDADNAAAAELSARKNSPRSSRNMTCPKARTARLIGSGRWCRRQAGWPPVRSATARAEYLSILLRETKAPLASRWGSILLRRALLSNTDTPGDVSGADWVAERAWMLVRMGEADAARALVQSVDPDQYSKRLYAVAMQAYLASADPVGLCSIQQGGASSSASPSWRMAEAICASFAAEQGRASAILNQTERKGDVSGIDYRLTEKIVGAGANARRSVKIEWDDVDRLTAWRYGLATAANVDIPKPLMNGVGAHVWAWQARAPMLSPAARLPAVEIAARLGVFSSSALVDFYSGFEGQEELPEGLADQPQGAARSLCGHRCR